VPEPGCNRVLQDYEIEFDHIHPGGSRWVSEESNIRVTCPKAQSEQGENVLSILGAAPLKDRVLIVPR